MAKIAKISGIWGFSKSGQNRYKLNLWEKLRTNFVGVFLERPEFWLGLDGQNRLNIWDFGVFQKLAKKSIN